MTIIGARDAARRNRRKSRADIDLQQTLVCDDARN
jgi:hypothetical protein